MAVTPEPAEVAGRLAVALQREDRTGAAVDVRLALAPAGIQADGVLARQVEAEADRPLGEAGLVVEDEALAPLLHLGAVLVAGALVDVEAAQLERGLAVLEKGRLGRGHGQGRPQRGQGHAQGEWSLVHLVSLGWMTGCAAWTAASDMARAMTRAHRSGGAQLAKGIGSRLKGGSRDD
ncbi:hypothetical protein GCM10027514_14600 [Azotobacter armeniacus]